MQIYIKTTGESANSTKLPDFTGITPYDCFLKTPSSIERPEIFLSVFIPGAKYAWIPDFNRYYFIENITVIHNERYSYLLSVDPLSSFRDQILALSVYCNRSSAGSLLLQDSFVTHTGEQRTTRTAQTSMYLDGGTLDFVNGSYLLETVGGGSSSGFGSTTMYLVTPATLAALMAEVFNASSTIYGNDISDDVVKTYFNPFQYIISCKWMPFAHSQREPENIMFGFWISSYKGVKIGAGSPGATVEFLIDVPVVNGANYESYSAAWVRHEIFVPGIGQFPIDPKYSGRTLSGKIYVDLNTGNANLDLCLLQDTTPYPVISTMSGQWCVPVQLSQLSVDAGNIATNTIAAAERITQLTGHSIFGSFAGKGSKLDQIATHALGMVTSLLEKVPLIGKLVEGADEAMAPTLATCGTNGNRFYMEKSPAVYIITTYFEPDNKTALQSKFNKPDDKVRTLSSLSGYTICQPEQAPKIGTAAENAAILAALTGGVYIE